jgi:RNA polymerase sigma factor (sigma-70 family)
MPSSDPLPAREAILEHQVFLRRLARSLVADPHGAEDLAQEAAVIALERPPRGEGSFRGWLARVVRNRAIDTARSERQRQAREQSSAPPKLPRTPEETEEQLHVQRRVFEAVAALQEPYRTAILLRYYHDLAPTEIAAQLGVPVATVKSHLARALARLRGRLDDTQPRYSRAWIAVLAGGFGELPRSAAATALAAGGVAMGVKLAIAVAAAGLTVVGGWWLLRPSAAAKSAFRPAAARPEASLTASVAVEEDLLEPSPETMRSVPTQDEPLASSPVPAELPPWSLALDLTGWSEGDAGLASIDVGTGPADPIAAMAVGPDVGSIRSTHELAGDLVLDVGPLFAEGVPRPERLAIRVDHPRFLLAVAGVLVPAELQSATATCGHLRASIELERAFASVSGRVVLDADAPADRVRAAIFGFDGKAPQREPSDLVRPAADGSFRLRARGAQRHVIVAFVDRQSTFDLPPPRPDTRILVLSEAEDVELDPLVLGEGEVIEGRAQLPDGRWPPKGRLWVELVDPAGWSLDELVWRDQRFETNNCEVVWGDGGEFRIRGLGAGAYSLTAKIQPSKSELPLISLARSRAARAEIVAPAAGARISLDLVRVELQVVGGGKPVDAARVVAHWKDPDGGGGASGGATDRKGRMVVELDPSDGLTLSVEDSRWPIKELTLSREEVLRGEPIEVVLEGEGFLPATLSIRPVGNHAALPPGTVIDFILYDRDQLTPDELAGRLRSMSHFGNSEGGISLNTPGAHPKRSDLDGTWKISDLQPGRYTVQISARSALGAAQTLVLDDQFDVELGSGGWTEHAWSVQLGGALRLNLTQLQDLQSAEFVDAQGVKLRQTYMKDEPTQSSYSVSTAAIGPGLFEVLPAFAAGTYELLVRLQDKSEHRVPVSVEAGRVNDVTIGPEDL